jgi:hypothetical protein
MVASMAHPLMAAKAFVKMHQHAFSQKKFDRWMQEVRDHPAYDVMIESGLFIADQNNPDIKMREESFSGSLGEKIPLFGQIVKGSARAYASYLNVLRVNMFLNAAEGFANEGFTPANAPDIYKSWASFVNSATGRGGLGIVEPASNLLSTAYFSPRLIASRVNLLGLSDLAYGLGGKKGFYGSMPPEVRRMAVGDVMKFVATASSVVGALAMWAGADDEDDFSVESDPRSTDFGKIRIGNTRWDLLGGFQQYVRAIAQIATEEKKKTSTDNIMYTSSESVAFRFNRSKLAPTTGLIYSALLGSGKNMVGEEIYTWGTLVGMLTPMIGHDIHETYKDAGVMRAIGVGVSNFYGGAASTYVPKGEKTEKSLEAAQAFVVDRER